MRINRELSLNTVGDIIDRRNLFTFTKDEFTWDDQHKITFITDIIFNKPIGDFSYRHTINELDGRSIYTVIDGNERINAVLDFYNNNILIPKDYLNIILPDENITTDCYFNDLPKRVRNWFINYKYPVNFTY